MQTKNVQNNHFPNENKTLNPKDFLNALENANLFTNYQNLGFTLKSLCKVAQTALLAETECKQLTCCHQPLDLFNLFSLIYQLLPNDEMELLDKLNS